MDGGRRVDGSPALAAGPGRGPRSGDGRGRPAPRASRDRPRVRVAVGSRAGVPGGPAAWPGLFPPVPGRRPRPCPAAPAVRARRPLPAAAGLASPLLVPRVRPPAFPSPARARAGLASPSRGCRPPAPAGPVASPGGAVQCPRKALSEGGGAGEPRAREGRGGGAAGVRRESVLPGPAAAPGVAVAVAASPARVGAPVLRRGWRRGTAPVPGGPVAVRSRGGPRRPTRVPSPGSLWAVPLAVARGHPTPAAGCAVSAPRGRIPSVPLSARPSASVPSPSAAPRGRVPWCASLPGPAAAPIRRPCLDNEKQQKRGMS